MRVLSLSTLAAGMAVVLSACGPAGMGGALSRQGGATGGDDSAACRLFSNAEIAAVAGRDVNKHTGADAELMGQSTCVYQGSEEGKTFQTMILYNPKAMELYQQAREAGEQVPGLGDEATWTVITHTLFVRKGQHGLVLIDLGSVNLSNEADPGARDAFKALAVKALSKI